MPFFMKFVLPAGNTNFDFTLDSSSGALNLSRALNRETLIYYDLLVDVSDNGTPPLSTQVQIGLTVTAVNEFTPNFTNGSFYSISLNENTAVGTSLLTVHAQDDDGGDQGHVTYSVVSGNSDGVFQLDGESGNLELKRNLDYEEESGYSLVVKASDNAPAPLTKWSIAVVNVTVVDLNDNFPVCSPQARVISLLESIPKGSVLFTANCTDQDSDANSVLSYQFTAGNSRSKFSVSPSGGVVTLVEKLNFEVATLFDLTLTVTDSGSPSRTTNISLVIDVKPVNEHQPKFDVANGFYQLNISENITLGKKEKFCFQFLIPIPYRLSQRITG